MVPAVFTPHRRRARSKQILSLRALAARAPRRRAACSAARARARAQRVPPARGLLGRSEGAFHSGHLRPAGRAVADATDAGP